jgi:hypothetical protein
MLELFSRLPDRVLFHGKKKVKPIPVNDEVNKALQEWIRNYIVFNQSETLPHSF